jgi:hypothetical protein
MPYQLSRLSPRIGKTHSEDHIIKTSFQKKQQIGACYSFLSVGLFKITPELSFQQAIHPFKFLLFPQLNPIIGVFLTDLTMIPWGITPSFKGTFFTVTPVPFEE